MNANTAFTSQSRLDMPCVSKASFNFKDFKRSCRSSLAGLGVAAAFLVSAPTWAATAPNLGATSTYGVVSETYTGNGAATNVSGNVCYTTGPGPFAPTIIGGGALDTPCTNGGDQTSALADLNSQSCTSIGAAVALDTISIGGGAPGVFPPGCYSSTGAMSITTGTTVTLNGAGVYIFRSGGALDPAANSNVVMAGSGCEADVFWAPVGATTIGANSSFVGSVFRGTAAGLSITLGNVSTLVGRALAFGSTVTTDNNTITVPTCAAYVAPGLPTITVTKRSVGGVGTFNFTGDNGFAAQAIPTVTSGVGVAGATQTLTASGVATTITEAAPPAGFTLASISCTGLGAGGTATADIGARSVALDAAATAAGAAIACTFTNDFSAGPALPTVTVTKVSNGAVGPFSFSGTNGFANETITTVTSGVGVSGLTQVLTAAGVSTTITESAPPAGYALASINCTGLGAGGTATANIGTRTVTLDAAATAAGAAIACTFTNTFSAVPGLPTVTVTKVSNGAVGPFSFTGSNGFANQTITTVTSGVGVPGATQILTAAGVSSTITESAPPAGYALASISCTGLGAGGTATANIGTRTVTLDAAATAAGAAIACTFTNTFSSIPVPPPPPPAAAASIPTLSEWAMMLLIFLMAIVGFTAMRKQAR